MTYYDMAERKLSMIEIDHISKTYAGKEKSVHAVEDVSLTIEDGEIYGIVGYSGAGKSTLVRCINFLENPDSGSITIGGFGTFSVDDEKLDFTAPDGRKRKATEKDLQALRSGIGMIFQHFNLLDRSTVFDNIAYPLKYRGNSRGKIEERVRELLKLVDLEDKIYSYPSELSGGQKQRVAIARALANSPKILLSDEATSALDPDATTSILKLLKDLNSKLGLTIVLITHEMEVVKAICSKMAVMENGRVVEQGNVYDVFARPEKEITRKFVNSTSNLSSSGRLFESNSSLLNLSKNDVLVKCTYDKEHVGEALISEISRRFNVNVNILLADVELLQDCPLGGMVEVISGNCEDIDAAIEYIRSFNVQVEVMADGRVD